MQGQPLLACAACAQALSHEGVPQKYSFLYAGVSQNSVYRPGAALHVCQRLSALSS